MCKQKIATKEQKSFSININDEFLIDVLSKTPDMKINNFHFQTFNYDAFSFLPENRDIDTKAVERWVVEIGEKKKDLDIPIIVDENMNILEGQHRFGGRKKLGLPILFYISRNIKKEHIADLQKGNKWTIKDYLKYFTKKGNTAYKKYKVIYDKFNQKAKRWINHNELRMIVMGHAAFSSKSIKAPFERGDMKFVRSYEEVNQFLEWMFYFIPTKLKGDLVRDRYFQRAVVNLYSYDNFDKDIFEKMISIKKYANSLEEFDFIKKAKAEDKVTKVLDFYNEVAKKKGKKYILSKNK